MLIWFLSSVQLSEVRPSLYAPHILREKNGKQVYHLTPEVGQLCVCMCWGGSGGVRVNGIKKPKDGSFSYAGRGIYYLNGKLCPKEDSNERPLIETQSGFATTEP